MTRIVAVRHGETDWNRHGRMQGWAPVPLNDTGREQAQTVGEWIAETYDVDRVFASDLVRTRETTELVLESIGTRPVSFEPAWRERGLGIYQGLTHTDVETRFPEFGLNETAYRAVDVAPEGGESFRDVHNRVVGRFEDLTDRGNGETILVVTHGGPLRMLLGHAKGMELPESLLGHRPENCAATEFRVDGDETTVVRENETRR